MITRTIDRNFANMRLDRFLRKAFPEESLSVFFAVIRKKKVRVNGVVGKANQILVEGDVVNIYENFKSVVADDSGSASSPTLIKPHEPVEGFAKNKSTWGISDEGRGSTGSPTLARDERLSSWGAKELDFRLKCQKDT